MTYMYACMYICNEEMSESRMYLCMGLGGVTQSVFISCCGYDVSGH